MLPEPRPHYGTMNTTVQHLKKGQRVFIEHVNDEPVENDLKWLVSPIDQKQKPILVNHEDLEIEETYPQFFWKYYG